MDGGLSLIRGKDRVLRRWSGGETRIVRLIGSCLLDGVRRMWMVAGGDGGCDVYGGRLC